MSPGVAAHIRQRPLARRATRPTRLRHKSNNERGRRRTHVAGRISGVPRSRGHNIHCTFCSARVLLIVLFCRWVTCGRFIYTTARRHRRRMCRRTDETHPTKHILQYHSHMRIFVTEISLFVYRKAEFHSKCIATVFRRGQDADTHRTSEDR